MHIWECDSLRRYCKKKFLLQPKLMFLFLFVFLSFTFSLCPHWDRKYEKSWSCGLPKCIHTHFRVVYFEMSLSNTDKWLGKAIKRNTSLSSGHCKQMIGTHFAVNGSHEHIACYCSKADRTTWRSFDKSKCKWDKKNKKNLIGIC